VGVGPHRKQDPGDFVFVARGLNVPPFPRHFFPPARETICPRTDRGCEFPVVFLKETDPGFPPLFFFLRESEDQSPGEPPNVPSPFPRLRTDRLPVFFVGLDFFFPFYSPPQHTPPPQEVEIDFLGHGEILFPIPAMFFKVFCLGRPGFGGGGGFVQFVPL